MDNLLKIRLDSENDMNFESLPSALHKSNNKTRVGKLNYIHSSTNTTNSAGGTQPYLPIPAMNSPSSVGTNIIVHTT